MNYELGGWRLFRVRGLVGLDPIFGQRALAAGFWVRFGWGFMEKGSPQHVSAGKAETSLRSPRTFG